MRKETARYCKEEGEERRPTWRARSVAAAPCFEGLVQYAIPARGMRENTALGTYYAAQGLHYLPRPPILLKSHIYQLFMSFFKKSHPQAILSCPQASTYGLWPLVSLRMPSGIVSDLRAT